MKNFNYSGQLKHREETTIKISIQCEVLIAWWLWLKFEKQIQRETKGSFDFSSEAACHGYDARSLSDIRQFCFPLGFNLNDSKVIPFFLRQQCDFFPNRTRHYHGVPLLVSRFNYIEILLFERLALCASFFHL